ncbi:hypothetical protein GCM10009557_82400 [Virgisporangium ochraceum]|uniref:Uncharacterized protein n=1 Tax=Virgisporangium ochraceum TaxID=65505 RepID=A0A8J3ZWI3_9ACTN|nr:hypothetical protein Voc01_037120 [Virgisporangium ochraceum]
MAAVALSVSTFVFLFLHDSWRSDNPFLVPDLVLCAGLLVAAALPARLATAGLPVVLGFAAGVFAVSVASYAVRDELGLPSLLGSVGAVVMALLLGRQGRVSPA